MKIKQIKIKWKSNYSLLAVVAPKVINRPVFMLQCTSLTFIIMYSLSIEQKDRQALTNSVTM